MNNLTHLNSRGEANMVDVADKAVTQREAKAQSCIQLTPAIVDAIERQTLAKGDLFAVARVAGIQAAKQCAHLIPLCHPLSLNKISIDFELKDEQLWIEGYCKTNGKTGVEMEALTATSIAALTIYDMCKGIDKGIIIQQTRLLSKSGGKSGDWQC